ncbi:MAG: tetratricopeptide repeat protein [Polyangiaceae bacterium]
MTREPERPRDEADRAHWDAVDEATELLHEERFQEALVFLADIAKADATNPYAFYYMAVAMFELGQLEPARDAYRACLKIAPEHLGARVALCHVLRSLGDHREAIREGMVALTQAPGDTDALHAVGLAYLARGDEPAARRYLQAFLEARPEFEAAEEVRGILAEMNDPASSPN